MLIPTTIAALIEMAVQAPVEHGWNQALRNDRILRVLDRVGLKPGNIPPDFEAVYAHTLVEWGAVKREDEIGFFRHAEVQQAFRRAFERVDGSDFDWETEGIFEGLSSHREHPRADPRPQLAEFAAIFRRLALASRTPGEVLRDQSIAEVQTEIGVLQFELQRLRQEQRDTEIIALLHRFTAAGPDESDREALRPYLEWVQRRSQRLAISALDPEETESEQIKLEDVFVSLDAGELAVDWPDDPQRRGVLTAALGHIFYHRQMVIRGDPGSGKSTLLHFLSYCLAGDSLDPDARFLDRLQWEVELQEGEHAAEGQLFRQRNQHESRETRTQHWQQSVVPILIELRNFAHQPFDPADPLTFWRYFKRYLEEEVFDAEMAQSLQTTRDALYHRATRGEVIWLFDGIDEAPLEQRRRVWQAVSVHESGVLGGGRWVATSRILSFDEALLPRRGIAVQTVRPLTLPQIDQFVGNWFQTLRQGGVFTGTEADTRAERLRSAVRHRGEDFFKMAANPMLLTIMALVQTYHGILPEQRARLYKACVDTLLRRWQRRKEPAKQELPTALAALGVDYGTLERLLWEVGWKAHEGARSREEAADISRDEVLAIAEKHLGSLARAAAFIEYTEQRTGILVGRGGQERDMYTFPHRTLQEHLAACHLVTQRRKGQRIRALAARADMWREVLNLAIGHLVFNVKHVEDALDVIAELLPEAVPDRNDETGWYQVWMAGELCAIVGQETTEKDEEGALLLPRLRSQLAALLVEGVLKAAERHEAANALAQLGDERPGVGASMVNGVRLPAIVWGGVVPAGEYTIGDANPKYAGEALRPVSITAPYRLAQLPVTVAQFDCFAGAADTDDERWWKGVPEHEKYRVHIADPRWSLSNRPRETVTWYQAVAFCRWLDHHLKAAAVIGPDDELDLPYEHEWEVAACYTGNGQCDRRIYPWGDEAIGVEQANYDETGLNETSAVGLFPAGRQRELGLYDLSGNVWEWCRNEYHDPGEMTGGRSYEPRTLRGGSWLDSAVYARVASRGRLYPSGRNVYFGFRVVRRLPSYHDH